MVRCPWGDDPAMTAYHDLEWGRALRGDRELFEALTLAQTGKVTSFPIVLFGSAYWGGLVDWLRDTMLADGKVGAADIDTLHVTDDIDEAISYFVGKDDA